MNNLDLDTFSYDRDSKFTEEILTIDFAKKNVNDIYFDQFKKCKDGDLIDGTTVCRNCYYRELLKKLIETKRSKRKELVEYQYLIRIQKNKFIEEISDFVIDNSSYFDDYTAEDDYLKIINNLSKTNTMNNQQINDELIFDIFISHASKDVETVKILIELLQLAFRIKDEKIRCTSVPGFKLKSGDSVDGTLLNDIKTSKLILGLMSQSSLESPYVLFEIGASWGANKIPMLIAKNKNVFSSLPKPLSNFHHSSLDDSSEVHDLLMEVSRKLEYENYNAARLDSKIKELVKNCKIRGSKIHQKIAANGTDYKRSNLEKMILSYAKTSEDGTISVSISKDGTLIQVDRDVLINSNLHKEVVPYIEILDSLVKSGFLSIDPTGKRYKFTSKAYEL